MKDFDLKELAAVGFVAESQDAFLCRLLATSPEEAAAAFFWMQDKRANDSCSITLDVNNAIGQH
jgi:hypothetical protein